MTNIDGWRAVRAARILAALDLSPTAVDASQTPDPVANDPRVKALVEAGNRMADCLEHGRMSADAVTNWDTALRQFGGEA